MQVPSSPAAFQSTLSIPDPYRTITRRFLNFSRSSLRKLIDVHKRAPTASFSTYVLTIINLHLLHLWFEITILSSSHRSDNQPHLSLGVWNFQTTVKPYCKIGFHLLRSRPLSATALRIFFFVAVLYCHFKTLAREYYDAELERHLQTMSQCYV